MIAAELRGGNKPSLNEALGWIGSRVDDIYGASVGRLEDVWIDPGTGVPRWLLVKEGRFGGRSTLVPFGDATAGAGHVWVPYERDVVREAPQIKPGVPLTQQVEATLRNHYAANAAAAVGHGSQPSTHAGSARQEPRATVRLAAAESIPSDPPERPGAHRCRHRGSRSGRRRRFSPHLRKRLDTSSPATRSPLESVPPPPPAPPQQPPYYQQPAAPPPQYQQPPAPQYQQPPPQYQQPPAPQYQPAAAPDPQYQPPPDPLAVFDAIPAGSLIEIELDGNLTIRGELRQVRITPPRDGFQQSD